MAKEKENKQKDKSCGSKKSLRRKKRKTKSRSNFFWGLAFSFLALGFLFKNVNSSSVQKTDLSSHAPIAMKVVKKDISHEGKVNHILKEMDEKIQWESAKVEVENFRYAPELDTTTNPGALFQVEQSLQFGVKEQENAPVIPTDLLDKVQYGSALDEKIDEKLWQEEVADATYQKDYEEYIKGFVENARRAGYKVYLDQNLKVTRVQKIR